MSEVMNVRGDECRGDECRTIDSMHYIKHFQDKKCEWGFEVNQRRSRREASDQAER